MGRKIKLVHLDGVRAGPKNKGVPEEVLKKYYANAARRVRLWRTTHDAEGHLVPPGSDTHMSQIAFAKRAKVSVGCIQGLENEGHHTRDPQLLTIAQAVGLHTIEELGAPFEDAAASSVAAPQESDGQLYRDDLEVAWMYRLANGPLKTNIRRMLVEYHQKAKADQAALSTGKETLRLPTEATFPQRSGIERRSGTDRRRQQDEHAADRRRAEGE